MKRIFTTLVAGLIISAQMMAVSVKDVCGQFEGNLIIDGTQYPNKSVYLLPGVVDSAVTFVLPDFMFNAGKLGNIVLPNIPMDATGKLTLDSATLYLDSISERATITVINGLEDGGVTYNSYITADQAQVILSIAAPSLPEPIYVLFQGSALRTQNYALTNGGFEGEWTNSEPAGWHSFNTATGDFVDFIKGTDQFVQSAQVRPGSKGAHSVMLSSKMALGAKANGNCTNGQINAGSSTAGNAAANYNFSDPTNDGFNTPFNGRPDSIVFWAKYQPADRNASNEINKARMSAIITTNARYQDPEATDAYADIKIGSASVNYAATNDMGWQRLSVPFEYAAANADKKPAYILTTFTTNMVPGGGSSYSNTTITSKVDVLDTVYLDDAEIIYNKELKSFSIDNAAQSFDKHIATAEGNYCDDCAKFAAAGNGISAQTFIGFDAAHKCIFIYVIADDYAQSGSYNLYRVDFADSETSELDPIVDPTEGIINTKSGNTQCTKFFYNGKLYIRRGNALYNVSGIRIQ
ncbi:MAG: calycin-like domain-containing protein [Paludibacteraceae bacterium]|nr:calycin-like domain-containing protein [Paludibacteraceae bacterium]